MWSRRSNCLATVFRPAWCRCICGLGGLTAWPQSLDQHGVGVAFGMKHFWTYLKYLFVCVYDVKPRRRNRLHQV